MAFTTKTGEIVSPFITSQPMITARAAFFSLLTATPANGARTPRRSLQGTALSSRKRKTNAAINGETDLVRGAQTVANQLLGRVSALTLIACLLTVAVLLSWFWLRKRPLEDAASLRPCSRWTTGFCIFGAMGLFVLISLVLYLLPERWMAEYGKAMTLSTETGLIPALAMVVGAPLAEELVFRGIIQSRLERSLPAWIAVVLQAVLFGLIHGTPVQIGYAFIMGLLFGLLRWRIGYVRRMKKVPKAVSPCKRPNRRSQKPSSVYTSGSSGTGRKFSHNSSKRSRLPRPEDCSGVRISFHSTNESQILQVRNDCAGPAQAAGHRRS